MRRAAWLLLLLFAFAIPWEYSLDAGPPLGNIARIAGLMLLLVAVPAIFQGGRVRTPGGLQWLVLSLFTWYCCTYFWSIDQTATLAGIRGFVQEMMTVWLVWEFAESPADLRALIRAYVAGCWVLALLTLANWASPDTAGQVRFAAAGQDPNDTARFLDIGFPLAALLLDGESRWAGKVLAGGYLPLGLISVVLTASRGGFVAAMLALAGCCLLLFRHHARTAAAVVFALPLFAAGVWFAVPHETLQRIATIPEQIQRGDLNQRLGIWSAGWSAFEHAPFFGTGASTFVSAARLAPIDTAHNTGLALLVEGGICALILGAAIVVVCARSVIEVKGTLRIALGSALIVWVVTSLVATVERDRTTWLLVALISVARRLAEEDPRALARCFYPNLRNANAAVIAGMVA